MSISGIVGRGRLIALAEVDGDEHGDRDKGDGGVAASGMSCVIQ